MCESGFFSFRFVLLLLLKRFRVFWGGIFWFLLEFIFMVYRMEDHWWIWIWMNFLKAKDTSDQSHNPSPSWWFEMGLIDVDDSCSMMRMCKWVRGWSDVWAYEGRFGDGSYIYIHMVCHHASWFMDQSP